MGTAGGKQNQDGKPVTWTTSAILVSCLGYFFFFAAFFLAFFAAT
jgi:hypothetical protein